MTKEHINHDITSHSSHHSAAREEAPRSIRNVNVASHARRASADEYEPAPHRPRRTRVSRGSLSWLMWTAVGVGAVAVCALSLFIFRPTTVTITPRTQPVVFDQSAQFVAYPETASSTASEGLLTYTTQTLSFEESAVLPVQKGAKVSAAAKATGNITVMNGYSSSPLKFVKDTRFETPDGLVFRALSDIVIPGMKKAKPGEVTVAVAADQPGVKYNVGPVEKLTLPGLKASPSYSRVFAKAATAFVGGTDGAEGAAAPGAVDSARSQMQTALEQKVRTGVSGMNNGRSVAFADLAMVSFSDAPSTVDDAGLHLSRKVTAVVPLFDASAFSATLAKAVSSDTEDSHITIIPGKGYTASPIGATSTRMGIDPLAFLLNGTATLVWQVDTDAIAKDLAGKDQSAFQTIVKGFSGVQEAKAKVEPFWNKTFPQKPEDITVTVTKPSVGKDK